MSNTINIAICEDNEQQLQINKHYIEQWAESQEQNINIFTYKSAESFLFDWGYDININIVFLDIHMEEISGIDLAHHIRKKNPDIDIIFISGEKQHILEGYKVQAVNFLLKPIKKEDIFESLNMWLSRRKSKENDYLIVKKGKNFLKLNYDDIYYLICFDHYMDIHTKDDVITFKQKIGEIEQKLPQSQFCRCHRSYIVNLKYINQIVKSEIILDNGVKIPVSKSRSNITSKSFLNYFNNR